ncbi:hypothetical protein H1R81_20435 [Emticicia sp. BO119]|nr:hypothetical protein [Emticicia sp. BO119]
MFEQEIKKQIQNFKNGATYSEVKGHLLEEYNEVDALHIITHAFNKYRLVKANKFILFGILLITITYLYHFFYKEIKNSNFVVFNSISIIIILYGLYQKFQYKKDDF